MTRTILTADELALLRAMRYGKPVTLTPQQFMRLSRRSMIRGSIDQPVITVNGNYRVSNADNSIMVVRLPEPKTATR